TGESEREPNRILTLDPARRNLDRHAKPCSRSFGARRILESLGHCYHQLANRTDLPDGGERVREHRATTDLHERLGHARPEPQTAARRDDDRRGCQFALPAFLMKFAIVPITATSTCPGVSYSAGPGLPAPAMKRWLSEGKVSTRTFASSLRPCCQ